MVVELDANRLAQKVVLSSPRSRRLPLPRGDKGAVVSSVRPLLAGRLMGVTGELEDGR